MEATVNLTFLLCPMEKKRRCSRCNRYREFSLESVNFVKKKGRRVGGITIRLCENYVKVWRQIRQCDREYHKISQFLVRNGRGTRWGPSTFLKENTIVRKKR